MTQDVRSVGEVLGPQEAESASLIVNRHHQVIDAHPSIDAIMAWPKADLIGHLLKELVHPGDLTILESMLSRSATGPAAQGILIRLQHAVKGWVRVSLTETTSETPEQRQFDVILQPKPAVQPQASQSSRALAEDLAGLVSAQSQVLVFDQALHYLWSSAGFTEVFKAEPQDLQAASLSEICTRFLLVEQAGNGAAINPTLLSSDAGWQGNVTTTIQGISQSFQVISQHQNLIKTEKGVLVLSFSATPTLQVEPEALAIDVCTSVRDIAHEFRNVFGVISGHAELMRSNPSANQSNSINQLSRYSRKAVDLLESLTLLGYLDDDRATHFNPISQVNALEPLLRLIAGERLTLHRQEDLVDFECFGRPANFDQALLATVRLATSITKSSAPIGIDLSCALGLHRHYGFLTLAFTLENVNLDLVPGLSPQAVSGIAAETAIFKQFHALSALGSEYQGPPSMNLSGSTLSLIVSLPGQPNATDKPQPNIPIERPIKQALLIEDDPGVRDLVELFLGSLGMDVTCCSSEQDVLKLQTYDFDIIVSDVMLASGKTGPDLVQGIRSKHPEIACLFISGYKHGALSSHDLSHPKTDFLAKPFSKNEFAKRVQTLLEL